MKIKDLLVRQTLNDSVALKKGNSFITYKEWNAAAEKIAYMLKSKYGDSTLNVGIFLHNSIEYGKAYFGILYSDKIVIPIDVKTKEIEILSTIKYHEIDVVITVSDYIENLKAAMSKYNCRLDIYTVDDGKSICLNEKLSYISKSNFIKQSGSDSDVVIMLHTSGTTSNPKRVMLTNENLITNIESNIASLKLCRDDKMLIALPMYFGYCNTAQFLTQVYMGGESIIMEGLFMPKRFFQLVQDEKVTLFTAVPTMLLIMLDYRYISNYDYSSLRYICFGGGKMPLNKLKLLIEKFPSVGFVQTYGQTECSPRVTALLPEHSLDKIGSVGKAIPNVKIKIVDQQGSEVRANEIGEILVQGKNIMKGYYKQKGITNKTIRSGWLHTGDLGYIDVDGFLYLTGRIKNIIISGGINIYPEEIEQVLLQNECVEDVLIYGEEDERLGEVPVAKIILKKEISSIELKKYCMELLADYKVPHNFMVVEKLPKTYNGKLKRRKLS